MYFNEKVKSEGEEKMERAGNTVFSRIVCFREYSVYIKGGGEEKVMQSMAISGFA